MNWVSSRRKKWPTQYSVLLLDSAMTEIPALAFMGVLEVEKSAGGCWWVETRGWGRKRVLVGPKRAMVCRKRRKGCRWVENGVLVGGKGVSVTGNGCWWVETHGWGA
jgi:hypothetical protein